MRRDSMAWQWRRLQVFPQPTIAMVNGWCFGGAFMPLVSCDSRCRGRGEVRPFGNQLGHHPGRQRRAFLHGEDGQADALHYMMTGDTFDGRKAAAMRLVNSSVPRAQLRERPTRWHAS